MTNLVAVDNKSHSKTKIDINKRELHGKLLHIIPVVLSEFASLSIQYPIVITKNIETGQFVFAAMLGFEPDENLFWQEDQWQGLYLPLHIRRQPFFVGNPESNSDYTVCIDSHSCAITSEGEYALFDDEGLDTDYFKDAKACLVQLLKGEEENKTLLAHLQTMGLLRPMSLEITFINQESTQLNGLYTIDQEKMATLSGENILSLHHAEVLPAIYTQIASLGQIQNLINLKNNRLR
jgi:hypothetical protein